ncbi:MAG: hypothetical protein CMA72_07010 [Euryarchaeota archaeon]|nr:hypothetical protein [Euryarchaeota archaeon]
MIRQEIVRSLEQRGDSSARFEISRLQKSKSLSDAFGFAGPGFQSSNNRGSTSIGAGGTKGFVGPGFKK